MINHKGHQGHEGKSLSLQGRTPGVLRTVTPAQAGVHLSESDIDVITLYGIKNCDTMKKARRWLDDNGVAYRFHDYRVDGLDRRQLRRWVDELGWETLLNRRGTTWRALPEPVRETLDAAGAVKLMLDNPAVIKRPLLDTGKRRLVGFDPEIYRQLLG